MDKMIASLKIPYSSGDQSLIVPSSLPSNLQGDFKASGQAIIQLVINGLFFLIIVTSLIFMLLAGIKMITSRGDAEGIKNAKKQLLYAIVGLVVASLGFFLVKTLITVLGGDPTVWKLPN